MRASLESAPVAATTMTARLSTGGAVVAEPAFSTAEADSSLQIFQQFMDETALPYLSTQRGDKLPISSQRVSDDQFRLLKMSVGSEWRAKVARLQAWCDERRQLDLQTKIQ